MAGRRNHSPLIKSEKYRSDGNNLRNSMPYNCRLQSAPPLSFQQYARSLTTVPGGTQWQKPKIYRRSSSYAYFSPEVREKPPAPKFKPWIHSYQHKYSPPVYTIQNYREKRPKPAEPIWHHAGRYIDKRPTSLSPEKRWQKPVRAPIWQPAGRPQPKSIPYFDAPNLRWSTQQLLNSTPDLRSRPLRASRSLSVMRSR